MSEKIFAKNAQAASLEVAALSTEVKNQILIKVAHNIKERAQEIIAANKKDVGTAINNGLSAAKIDRLTLDEVRINSLAHAVMQIAQLEDPIGKVSYDVNRENGLHIQRVSVPIGVILAVYEARPNVTSDIAALGIKSGNAVILRSGKECFGTSKIIAEIYQNTLKEFAVNPDAVSYVPTTDRTFIQKLLKLDEFIDVVVPRGGKDLIKAIMKSTKIPVFKHLDGNCHTYIESHADLEKAIKITMNAKLRRVGICGATESLLIDKKIAGKFLPEIAKELIAGGCEIRGDNLSIKIAKESNMEIKAATNQDFYTEYLDKVISVKIVKNIEDAINHINKYSSAHTESIITEDKLAAEKFLKEVNSAIVMHNASTQFADGGEFGLGAEVGISTGKLHARGPVGLEQLTIYKYVVRSECALRK